VLDRRLAERIVVERNERQWSVAELAERAGVSRAMIAKIEAGQARPTASLLGKVSAAFALPLSTLFKRIEAGSPTRLARAADQPVWRDPETGYVRRALSPCGDGPLQLTLIRLPSGARVSYPAEAYTYVHTQICVLNGTLTFREGSAVHTISRGDCLALGQAAPCTFANDGAGECRYIVAVARR
jgi:transcriptional regulator with XRE-family HTH domain